MNKSNHIAFGVAAVIVMAILLFVGNWAIPVQAHSGNIITPTPTGTPHTPPSGQGKPVSPEQQEELKSVIQSYFEIRYRALSTSQPDGFKLDGFGNLVSDREDAKAFLDAELGKMAIEISRAELFHLKYADYKYFLEFRNILVDNAAQIATILVVEEHDVVYENLTGTRSKAPIVSHLYNREHKIILRNEQGRWKIVSDNYSDYLWRMLRETGKPTQEMVKTMEASLNVAAMSETVKTVPASPLSADASFHDYNRVGAVDYALNHIDSYNPNYPIYAGQGGDCTNFVSQALYEGGNASMFIPSPLPAPSPDGQSGWYLLNDLQRAAAWNDVTFFHTFVTSESQIEPYPGGEWFGEGPEGYDVTIGELMLGDVIQYECPESKQDYDNVWDHAVIVVGFDGNGNPLVASHTDDVGPEPYTYFSLGRIFASSTSNEAMAIFPSRPRQP